MPCAGAAGLKDNLQVDLELASPLDFCPVTGLWEERSPLIRRIGEVSFRAKLERGHAQRNKSRL
jgi:hypothetical protein